MEKATTVKIQIKTGLSFCDLSKEHANDLNELIQRADMNGRGEFINEALNSQFSIWIEDQGGLKELDELLKKHDYQNRAEWLRDVIRKQKSFYSTRDKYGHNPSDADVNELITQLVNDVDQYGLPDLYFQSFELKGTVKITKVEVDDFYITKVRLYWNDSQYFTLGLHYGTLVECRRPDNYISKFHKCYRVKSRMDGNQVAYVGWRDEDN